MISEHRFLGKHAHFMWTFEKEQWFQAKRPLSKVRCFTARPAFKPNNNLQAGRNNLSQKTSY